MMVPGAATGEGNFHAIDYRRRLQKIMKTSALICTVACGIDTFCMFLGIFEIRICTLKPLVCSTLDQGVSQV